MNRTFSVNIESSDAGGYIVDVSEGSDTNIRDAVATLDEVPQVVMDSIESLLQGEEDFEEGN